MEIQTPSNTFLTEVSKQAIACQDQFNQFGQLQPKDSEVMRLHELLLAQGAQFRTLRAETATHADRGKIYAREVQRTLQDLAASNLLNRRNCLDTLKRLKQDASALRLSAEGFHAGFCGISDELLTLSNALQKRVNEILEVELPLLEQKRADSERKQRMHHNVATAGGVALGLFGGGALALTPFTLGASAVAGNYLIATSVMVIGTGAATGVTSTAGSKAQQAKREADETTAQIFSVERAVEQVKPLVEGISRIRDVVAEFAHFWGEVEAQLGYLADVYGRIVFKPKEGGGGLLFGGGKNAALNAVKLWKEIEANYDTYAVSVRRN